jgi:putative nucleotidyltransferase with HDIG domain
VRSAALEVARTALAPAEQERTWLVGGAVRDALEGRATDDIDIVTAEDVAAIARAIARAGRGVAFELSEQFGAWRVVERDHAWQIDIAPLRGGSLEADLAQRDFTVNAIAQPLAGGELVDPSGGVGDLERRRLRIVGPDSLREDPLRALRLVRLACERALQPDQAAIEAARAVAPALAGVAAERVFAELKRIVICDRALDGLALLDEVGLTGVVLPELSSLRGVEQNRFHHLDVAGHTREVLAATIELQRDPGAVLGVEHAAELAELLREPLADELTRGDALRFGALLHDIAKPLTRGVTDQGRVIFPGHDERGAALAREILTRLRASERLRAHVAALTRHHLRLGFLVHRRPLSRRELYRYLDACDEVAVDVTLLSVADRLATRGEAAEESTARHVELARELLPEILRWRREGRTAPLLRGDELARELELAPGPELGQVVAELAEAQFAGDVTTREEAVGWARERRGRHRAVGDRIS